MVARACAALTVEVQSRICTTQCAAVQLLISHHTDYERHGSCQQWPAYKKTEKEGQHGICVELNWQYLSVFLKSHVNKIVLIDLQRNADKVVHCMLPRRLQFLRAAGHSLGAHADALRPDISTSSDSDDKPPSAMFTANIMYIMLLSFENAITVSWVRTASRKISNLLNFYEKPDNSNCHSRSCTSHKGRATIMLELSR